MDEPRQKLFKKRLHALMAGLTISQKDPQLMGVVGKAAGQLLSDTRTKDWTHLKSALNAESYDKVLEALQKGGAEMKKAGRPLGVRGFETIGVSLIARHQADPDLIPIVDSLDRYIETCIKAVKTFEARKKTAGTRVP